MVLSRGSTVSASCEYLRALASVAGAQRFSGSPTPPLFWAQLEQGWLAFIFLLFGEKTLNKGAKASQPLSGQCTPHCPGWWFPCG